MANDRPGRAGRRDGILALLALVGIVALLLAPPHGLLDKADHAAYAVCHRIPERTFVFAGRQLPLCARCTGTYLGALAGWIVLWLRGRGQAGHLPAARHLILFGIFVLAWAVDGLNSYLTFFSPVLPHLYEPHNILRLMTGTLEGLAIAAFLLPLLNISLRANPRPIPSVGSWQDLAWMAVGGAAVIGLVSGGWAPLLYPFALISGATIVVLIGAVNTMIAAILLRWEGRARRTREIALPLLVGVFLAVGEITLIGIARSALTARYGLPF